MRFNPQFYHSTKIKAKPRKGNKNYRLYFDDKLQMFSLVVRNVMQKHGKVWKLGWTHYAGGKERLLVEKKKLIEENPAYIIRRTVIWEFLIT